MGIEISKDNEDSKNIINTQRYINYVKSDRDILISIDNNNQLYNDIESKIKLKIKDIKTFESNYYISLYIPDDFKKKKFIRNLMVTIYLKKINKETEIRVFLDSTNYTKDKQNLLNENLFICDIGELFIRFEDNCIIQDIILKINKKYF